MTLDNLCEEFRVADEIKLQKKQQKRAKKKARRQPKPTEVCLVFFSSHFQITNNRLSRRKISKALIKPMKIFLTLPMYHSFVIEQTVVVLVYVIIVMNAQLLYQISIQQYLLFHS
jgi:hypothetical protein